MQVAKTELQHQVIEAVENHMPSDYN
jgi:hypothetical protein